VLANTEGDDGEVDDEDEEQRIVQSEMDGVPQVQYRGHDLSAKAGIILVCLLSSSAAPRNNATFPGIGFAQHLRRDTSIPGYGHVIDNLRRARPR